MVLALTRPEILRLCAGEWSNDGKVEMTADEFKKAVDQTKLGPRNIQLASLRLISGLTYKQISASTAATRETIRKAELRIKKEWRLLLKQQDKNQLERVTDYTGK